MRQVRAILTTAAALKFEQQQRLFQELGGGSGRNMHALEAEGEWNAYCRLYYGYEDQQDYYAEGAEEEWNGIQRVSCGSTLPQSTKIQSEMSKVWQLDTCRRIPARKWVV